MNTVTAFDLLIIASYLLAMLLLGVILSKKINNAKSFYTADNSIGTFALMATSCATMVGGSSLIGRAGLGYTGGIECLITVFSYMVGMFVFSAIAGRIHDIGNEKGIFSVPALFELRFGKKLKILVSILVVFSMVGSIAAQISATATIIKVLGSRIGISYEVGAAIATLTFVAYTGVAGFYGVVYTDVAQFILLMICVYILAPAFSINQLGGVAQFVSNIDRSLLIPKIDGRIFGDILSFFVFTMASCDMWQRAFSA